MVVFVVKPYAVFEAKMVVRSTQGQIRAVHSTRGGEVVTLIYAHIRV